MSEGSAGAESRKDPPAFQSPRRSQIGTWDVDPNADQISSNGASVKLEPRTMRLLLYLMEHRDRVVGQQELLDNIWANVVVTPQSVYSTIAQLRQALGDSTDSPSYIATIPRKGYRLIAAVSAGPSPGALPAAAPAPETVRADVSTAPVLTAQPQPVTLGTSSLRVLRGLAIVAGVVLSILAIIYLHMHRESQRPAQQPLAVSIGVLPFLDLSEKQDSQYLADGVTEELINILAHESALRVPARTSSFYFKGRTETVAAIARQLKVANLLEGSVRRSDGKIRVTAQLIRADDGFHLWSETYTRDGEDIFAVEDDIAQSVANVLRARLTPSVSVGTARPLDSAAHNLMLECQFYRERNTAADGEKAVACFRRLVESHTDSAPAWAGYADALMRSPMLSDSGIAAQRAAGVDAVDAARRALALDPRSAAAYAVIANYLRIFEHDWHGAQRALETALSADGNDPIMLLAASSLARDLGHLNESIALCERARINDPLNFQPYARLGEAYLYLGRLADAEAMARRRLDLSPNGSGGHMQLISVLLARGRPQEALDEIDQESFDFMRRMAHVMTFDALGRRAEADSALAYIISRFADRQPAHIAEMLAARGETDRAFEFLDKAVTSGDRNVLNLKSNYYFRRFHADPRYRALLERLSLPFDS